MKNRTAFLILAAVILGAIYAYKFTDWFSKKEIQIKYRSTVARSPKAKESVSFFLDQEYKITSIKVVSTENAATNKYPRALWHLISDSNSIPLRDFNYGAKVVGMKPKIAGLLAEPLQTTGRYRIFIEAGKRQGEKDFQMR